MVTVQTYRKLQTGIDAMEFVKSIPDEIWKIIDLAIWDPAYYDDDNPKHIEKINRRGKFKGKRDGNGTETRLMNRKHREKILEYIRSKTNDIHILHFHTEEIDIDPLACIHVWVKPIINCSAGNCDRNNGEYIFVEGKKVEGKLKGRVLNKYINAGFKSIVPRSCAKPTFLYSELYRHLDSKFVLDVFAGYGNSIVAADNLGISIYACDIDSKLNWDKKQKWEDHFTTLEGSN